MIDLGSIPEYLADSLNISSTAAEMVLTSAVLLAAGLMLAMLRGSNMLLIVVVELSLLGMLTAIGWVDAWLLVMVVLVIALMFGSKLRDWGDQTFRKGD